MTEARGVWVPAGEGEGTWEDRGSRFLAFAFPVAGEPEFEERLLALRQRHPKARHHCWAWRLRDRHRFSDDGEPGGTAGRPILQALEAAELVDAACVVVRWFGGVKLGTGGLVRAYGGAAARAVQACGRRFREEERCFRLFLPFELLGLRSELESACPGLLWEEDAFTDSGWRARARLPASEAPALLSRLREGGARGVVVEPEDRC